MDSYFSSSSNWLCYLGWCNPLPYFGTQFIHVFKWKTYMFLKSILALNLSSLIFFMVLYKTRVHSEALKRNLPHSMRLLRFGFWKEMHMRCENDQIEKSKKQSIFKVITRVVEHDRSPRAYFYFIFIKLIFMGIAPQFCIILCSTAKWNTHIHTYMSSSLYFSTI